MFLSRALRLSAAAGTTSPRSVFVSCLPWTVGKKELKEYFSQFGPVQLASVVYNRETGISRGYGFVEFQTGDGRNAALEHEHHVIDGRMIAVAPSTEYSPHKSGQSNDRNSPTMTHNQRQHTA